MKRRYSFYWWAIQSVIGLGMAGLYLQQPFPLLTAHAQGPPAFHLNDLLLLLGLAIGSAVAAIVEWRHLRAGTESMFTQQLAADREAVREVTFAEFKEISVALYYELRRAVPRARRRWPSKRKELRMLLARRWSRQERQGVGVYLGGHVLLLALGCWFFPYFGSGSATTWLVSIGLLLTLTNALLLLVWLADDDDEGGDRNPRPKPRPLYGLVRKLTLRTRRQPAPPVPRTAPKSPVY